jgi:hypothetical protein
MVQLRKAPMARAEEAASSSGPSSSSAGHMSVRDRVKAIEERKGVAMGKHEGIGKVTKPGMVAKEALDLSLASTASSLPDAASSSHLPPQGMPLEYSCKRRSFVEQSIKEESMLMLPNLDAKGPGPKGRGVTCLPPSVRFDMMKALIPVFIDSDVARRLFSELSPRGPDPSPVVPAPAPPPASAAKDVMALAVSKKAIMNTVAINGKTGGFTSANRCLTSAPAPLPRQLPKSSTMPSMTLPRLGV